MEPPLGPPSGALLLSHSHARNEHRGLELRPIRARSQRMAKPILGFILALIARRSATACTE